jgi:hypothetical protein
MALTQTERNAIIDAAFNKTKAEFATEVAARTTLKHDEVLALGKTAAERQSLAEVLDAVSKATASNTAKASAIRGITGGVEALIKIAERVL